MAKNKPKSSAQNEIETPTINSDEQTDYSQTPYTVKTKDGRDLHLSYGAYHWLMNKRQAQQEREQAQSEQLADEE